MNSDETAPDSTLPVAEVRSIAWRDRLGICLSVICLIHCLLTPFIFGLLPVGVTLGFWQHGFHEVFLLLVPMVALLAFIPGWRRHRDMRVWYWAAAGIGFLAVGVALGDTFSVQAEIVPTLIGGTCLIRAHLLNRELCVCCDHDHKPA